MDTKDKTEAQATANRIIDGIGGTTETAELCKTSESAVSQWRTNGIPEPRLMYLQVVRPDLFKPDPPLAARTFARRESDSPTPSRKP